MNSQVLTSIKILEVIWSQSIPSILIKLRHMPNSPQRYGLFFFSFFAANGELYHKTHFTRESYALARIVYTLITKKVTKKPVSFSRYSMMIRKHLIG